MFSLKVYSLVGTDGANLVRENQNVIACIKEGSIHNHQQYGTPL